MRGLVRTCAGLGLSALQSVVNVAILAELGIFCVLAWAAVKGGF